MSSVDFTSFLGQPFRSIRVTAELMGFIEDSEVGREVANAHLVLVGAIALGLFFQSLESRIVYFVPFSQVIAISFDSSPEITAHGSEKGGEEMSCTPTVDSS